MFSCKGLLVLILSSLLVLRQVIDARTITKRDTTCPSPYHVLTADNRCVWSCSDGTTPDEASNECVCESGYQEMGTDEFGRRVCGDCTGPYHVLSLDGRCVWSCSEGTTPDDVTNECICQGEFNEIGTDQFGRRVCGDCIGPYHVASEDGRCVWSCGEGTEPGLQGSECICQAGLFETGTDELGRRLCGACQGPYHVLASDGRCVWSCGEGTTPDSTGTECICKPGLLETGTDRFQRRVCGACQGPYHVMTPNNKCVWSCGRGTKPDNASNECICQQGLFDIGHDEFGRRYCGACSAPYHLLNRNKQCLWTCGAGTMPDPYGTECIYKADCAEKGTDLMNRRICK